MIKSDVAKSMFDSARSQQTEAQKKPPSSAFLALATYFIENGADASKLPKKYKRALRCVVHKITPQIILSDSHFQIAGYLTSQALEDYAANV